MAGNVVVSVPYYTYDVAANNNHYVESLPVDNALYGDEIVEDMARQGHLVSRVLIVACLPTES